MRKSSLFLLATFLLATYPAHAFAAKTFKEVVDTGIVPLFDKFVIPLLYAILFLLFMFGMVRYFFTGGEENREKGKSFVVWALIGMVAVFSVWGVVNLLLNVLAV
jgi:Type IV secretion system pilin